LCFRLTSTESYFVSEALYCPPEELDNSRKVTLQVATLGKQLASPDKVNTPISFTLLFIEIAIFEVNEEGNSPGTWKVPVCVQHNLSRRDTTDWAFCL
jgi:hypothetical protein